MEDGTGMTMAEQIGMDRWYEEVADYCREFEPHREDRDFTAGEYDQLKKLFAGGYDALSAAEAICGIE